MDLKPLILGLLLTPVTHAYESVLDEPVSGSTAWRIKNGMDAYPQPEEYGTRTDLYLMGDGEIQVQKHLADDEGDEINVYDYQALDEDY